MAGFDSTGKYTHSHTDGNTVVDAMREGETSAANTSADTST